MNWANRHLRHPLFQWDGVLFSDESRFCLSHVDGRARVWRRQGERLSDCCIYEMDRYGAGSVMVWGGISSNHRTPLHIFHANVNALEYQNVLQTYVVPFFQAHQEMHTFQQDNARPHVAHVNIQYLHQHHLNVLPWPAYSPDMSPIEHIWDELGRRVRSRCDIHTLQQLEQALVQEWNALPQRCLREKTRSMRRRCQACITARGGHTRY